ncbi:hypothetical protein F5876DRAFT_71001 [Lentinula aff. lateritia]|uniref:Uncharacterized protein n=1 Tax=Lentinula aff. lateritia TaxID=2804960 RepID=A0ACC1TH01_9AGAR|nr:hypothetical protein F5876DRAFT_71001 [Lentinula aff. lateritia]
MTSSMEMEAYTLMFTPPLTQAAKITEILRKLKKEGAKGMSRSVSQQSSSIVRRTQSFLIMELVRPGTSPAPKEVPDYNQEFTKSWNFVKVHPDERQLARGIKSADVPTHLQAMVNSLVTESIRIDEGCLKYLLKNAKQTGLSAFKLRFFEQSKIWTFYWMSNSLSILPFIKQFFDYSITVWEMIYMSNLMVNIRKLWVQLATLFKPNLQNSRKIVHWYFPLHPTSIF